MEIRAPEPGLKFLDVEHLVEMKGLMNVDPRREESNLARLEISLPGEVANRLTFGLWSGLNNNLECEEGFCSCRLLNYENLKATVKMVDGKQDAGWEEGD